MVKYVEDAYDFHNTIIRILPGFSISFVVFLEMSQLGSEANNKDSKLSPFGPNSVCKID